MSKFIVRSQAPLRLGLAGGGTDVSPYSDLYGGAVLNSTISLYTYTTLELLNEPRIILEALEKGERCEYKLSNHLEIDGLMNLHKAVYNRIVRAYNKAKPIPIRVITYSDAPPGSGLGTSSALVVSMVSAYQELLGLRLSEYELARVAYEIERLELRMAGGKQDQYAATFGGFNFIEFGMNDKVVVNPLRIKKEYVAELRYNLLLYYTGTSRISADIINSQIKNVKANLKDSVGAMHRLKEQAIMMKEVLLKGEINKIGDLLNFGWHYKKQMADNISNPFIDKIFEKALKCGVRGGKISGAGGGGFLMLYCDGLRRYEIFSALEEFGGRFLDFQFGDHGVEAWRV